MTDILFIIGLILGGVLLLGVLYGCLRLFVRGRRKKADRKVTRQLYQITVAKGNERGALAAEQMYANIHGIYQSISALDALRGKSQTRISFEVAHIQGVMYFYLWMPENVAPSVLGQLYAQYPDIEIVPIADYGEYYHKVFQKNPNFKAISMDLEMIRPDIYPIKKYQQFQDSTTKMEVDPLSGILSSMTYLANPQDQLWLQCVIEPLPESWHKVGLKFVKALEAGTLKFLGKSQYRMLRILYYTPWYLKILFFPFFIPLKLMTFGSSREEDKAAVYDQEMEQNVSTGEQTKGDTVSKSLTGKVAKLGFKTSIRSVYLYHNATPVQAEQKLMEIASSFKQFNLPYLNGFAAGKLQFGEKALDRYARRTLEKPFILNSEELATVYHLPTINVSIPNIAWVQSKKLEPPSNLPKKGQHRDITLIGRTNFRTHRHTFGMLPEDRRRHTYVIGKTGMGKSTLLENMLYEDIQAGRGVAVIDPHGDLADAVLSFVPASRINDVVMFSPSDVHFPIGFNMLENVNPEHRSLITSGLVGVFKKLYADSWGPRLEHILRNTIMALLETPNPTMLGILRILVDKKYRRKVVDQVTDPVVKSFWIDEFEMMQDRQRTEAISPIQNKVGQFLSSPIVRNIVGQPHGSIDLRFIMDTKKILVVNLSKGLIGEDNSALLGSMLITKFQLDAMSRADMLQKDREDFYLYVDEFQNFATDSFATILSEARKYRLNLIMANQYIAQMPDTVKDAVFGNVGTIASFQVGPDDAEYLAQQFADALEAPDLVTLSKYSIYLKLLVDGMPTQTFSANTLPPPAIDDDGTRREKIIKVVRERYSKKRDFVEQKIKEWTNPSSSKKKKG